MIGVLALVRRSSRHTMQLRVAGFRCPMRGRGRTCCPIRAPPDQKLVNHPMGITTTRPKPVPASPCIFEEAGFAVRRVAILRRGTWHDLIADQKARFDSGHQQSPSVFALRKSDGGTEGRFGPIRVHSST